MSKPARDKRKHSDSSSKSTTPSKKRRSRNDESNNQSRHSSSNSSSRASSSAPITNLAIPKSNHNAYVEEHYPCPPDESLYETTIKHCIVCHPQHEIMMKQFRTSQFIKMCKESMVNNDVIVYKLKPTNKYMYVHKLCAQQTDLNLGPDTTGQEVSTWFNKFIGRVGIDQITVFQRTIV
jgi:hypothetical protein